MAQRPHSGEGILIISALLIAYFIWLIGKMGNIEEGVVDAPVVVDVPEHIEAEPSRKFVNIQVRYPKSQRREVHSGAFQLVIDSRNWSAESGIREPREVSVPLVPDDVRSPVLPPSVEVQKVEPSLMTVRVKFRTREARIVPQFVDPPPPGYRHEDGKTRVNPQDRLVTGGPESLARLSPGPGGVIELRTSPISLAGQRDPFSTSVAILLPEGVSLLDEENRRRLPQDMTFAFVQVMILTTRTLEGIPIQVPTLSRNLIPRTEPATGSVTLDGPRTLLERLDANAVQIWPKTPPDETPEFVGEIAIEARKNESVPADVRIVGVRPDVVLLRYETKAAEKPTTPTLTP